MSASFHCDGCGKQIVIPIIIGHVLKRDYCDECAGRADTFLKAEEAIRKVVHEQFVDARAALIAGSSANGFKLPDVP